MILTEKSLRWGKIERAPNSLPSSSDHHGPVVYIVRGESTDGWRLLGMTSETSLNMTKTLMSTFKNIKVEAVGEEGVLASSKIKVEDIKEQQLPRPVLVSSRIEESFVLARIAWEQTEDSMFEVTWQDLSQVQVVGRLQTDQTNVELQLAKDTVVMLEVKSLHSGLQSKPVLIDTNEILKEDNSSLLMYLTVTVSIVVLITCALIIFRRYRANKRTKNNNVSENILNNNSIIFKSSKQLTHAYENVPFVWNDLSRTKNIRPEKLTNTFTRNDSQIV